MNLYKNITESSVDAQANTAQAIHDIIVANMSREELNNSTIDTLREVTIKAINEIFDTCESEYRSLEEVLTEGLFFSADEFDVE